MLSIASSELIKSKPSFSFCLLKNGLKVTLGNEKAELPPDPTPLHARFYSYHIISKSILNMVISLVSDTLKSNKFVMGIVLLVKNFIFNNHAPFGSPNRRHAALFVDVIWAFTWFDNFSFFPSFRIFYSIMSSHAFPIFNNAYTVKTNRIKESLYSQTLLQTNPFHGKISFSVISHLSSLSPGSCFFGSATGDPVRLQVNPCFLLGFINECQRHSVVEDESCD